MGGDAAAGTGTALVLYQRGWLSISLLLLLSVMCTPNSKLYQLTTSIKLSLSTSCWADID